MSEKYRLPIRLYRQHDLDLIALFLQTETFLPSFAKGCIKMFAAGKKEYFIMPKIESIPNDSQIHNHYQMTLYFDTIEDVRAIALLESIRDGYKNGFVKNVIRSYMYGGYCAHYFNDPRQIEDYYKMMNSLNSSVLNYDSFCKIRPDKISDGLLQNESLQLHRQEDLFFGAETAEKKEEKKTAEVPVEKEVVKAKKEKKQQEKPKKEAPHPNPKETETSLEPILMEKETPQEIEIDVSTLHSGEVTMDEQQEFEDLFGAMMGSL